MTNAELLINRIRDFGLDGIALMEVCGTHTMAIAKSGIRRMLPDGIRLLSGPGCPVCVTPPGVMDAVLRLSERPDIIVATYGDMVRVPGSVPGDNLRARSARGARVRVVYSPMDALDLAQENPSLEVVFLGVGFETTAPGTAASVLAAQSRGLRNFSLFPMLKRVEPSLRALLSTADVQIDGLLCPGHVAVILGEDGFRFLPQDYRMPSVISGFEPEDILLSVYRLCRQIAENKPQLENTYARAVSKEGNSMALAVMNRCFVPVADTWRGLGLIPDSGLALREEYADFDALRRFSVEIPESASDTACRCGDIIRGILTPGDCPLFGSVCTPEDPVGPCMVSGEGACSAAFKYGEVSYE